MANKGCDCSFDDPNCGLNQVKKGKCFRKLKEETEGLGVLSAPVDGRAFINMVKSGKHPFETNTEQEEACQQAQHYAQRRMHETCSVSLNDAKGKICNLIESIGLPQNQESAIKDLIKMFLNGAYQEIDHSNREYVQVTYGIMKLAGIDDVYLGPSGTSDSHDPNVVR